MKASFKINNVSYEFKTVSLRMYYDIREILKTAESKEAEFKIVSSLTDCPVSELKKLKFTDWLTVWTEAQMQLSAMSTDTQAIRPIVEFKGKKFGLPAVEDLTIGEFTDLDIIMSENKAEEKLAEIAAVLYRPIIKQKGEMLVLEPYTSEGFKERLEDFRDFPLWAIRSANAFFLQSANSLLRNTAESLVKKSQKQNLTSPEGLEALQKLLLQDPGGDLSIQLQERTLLDLTKLRSSQSELLSTGLLGRKTRLSRWLGKWNLKLNTK